MPNLKEIKGRINSVVSTQQITKAMKMVAAAKLRKAQDRITQMRPYSQKLQEVLANVTAATEEQSDSPYLAEREVQKVLLVLVTSDRGLCGGFNSYVQKRVLSLLQDRYKRQNDAGMVDIMTVGKKGKDFFQKREVDVIDDFSELFLNLNFQSAKEAAEYVMGAFKNERYDRVELIYNEFKNVATQIVIDEIFLPIQPAVSEDNKTSNDYIFEPSEEEILQELIPKALKIAFYSALLESNAAEHGARMTAMDKATENAGDLLKQLRLTYNRTRQAAITKEILEIVGGAEALAQS